MSNATASAPDEQTSFLSDILTPGSSLQPRFLLIVDGVLSCLLVLFLTLFYISSWSIHFVVLIGIELALWASIKWVIWEVNNGPGSGIASVDVDEKKQQ
ncbi:hypothetical protein SISNIDRAFT_481548 [Sistotremastrum niveocremeum HHB9708]|uniref:Pkr1-domain-containing protein n=1 Tax=Sistotremastrum niveocremeum HHB9708 TaxID=1314777 RepID=A0A164ZDQ7_9AGAM|nr:hypothetical protein SISNIDRAFT_481548 [Sistotremastrum niveocremeum HHB9708]